MYYPCHAGGCQTTETPAWHFYTTMMPIWVNFEEKILYSFYWSIKLAWSVCFSVTSRFKPMKFVYDKAAFPDACQVLAFIYIYRKFEKFCLSNFIFRVSLWLCLLRHILYHISDLLHECGSYHSRHVISTTPHISHFFLLYTNRISDWSSCWRKIKKNTGKQISKVNSARCFSFIIQ